MFDLSILSRMELAATWAMSTVANSPLLYHDEMPRFYISEGKNIFSPTEDKYPDSTWQAEKTFCPSKLG